MHIRPTQCGGQSIQKSVLYPARQVWYKTIDLREMEDLVGLMGDVGQEPYIGST